MIITRKRLQLLLATLILMLLATQFSLLQQAANTNQNNVMHNLFQPPVAHNATLNIRSRDLKKSGSKQVQDLPLSSPFCFVHVGKTAGGTISCRLSSRLAKSCPRKAVQAPNAFTSKVVGKLHKNRDWGCTKQPKNLPKVFLFALRDPVERIRSWFIYEHPRLGHIQEIEGNRPYLYDCFDTIEELSRSGLQLAIHGSTWASEQSLNCAKRACNAITGKVGFVPQLLQLSVLL